MDRSVQGIEVSHELGQPSAERRPHRRREEEGYLAMTVHGLRERKNLPHVDPVPPSECLEAHLRPEGALSESSSTAAQSVLDQPSLPEVPDLAGGEEPWELPEHAVEEGAPASAEAADVGDFDPLRRLLRRWLWREGELWAGPAATHDGLPFRTTTG